MARRPLTKRGIVGNAASSIVADLQSEGKGKRLNLPLLAGGRSERRRRVAEGAAAELGLPLYTVDLSYVVNKYSGETEKSLSDVFNMAETGRAVLFFDDADAVFGKRPEAKAVRVYLEKRLRRHRGLVLLGSSEPAEVDDPFLGKRLRIVGVVGRRPPSGPARRSA